MHVVYYRETISSRFSSNSEANASELLGNREEMVTDYANKYLDILSIIIRLQRVKNLQIIII